MSPNNSVTPFPTKQCFPDWVPTTDNVLHEDCVRIYQLMAADNETLLNQAIALLALSRLTFGEPDGAGWREQFRRLWWVEGNYGSLLVDQHASNRAIHLDIDAFLRDGELAYMRSVLRNRGIAVDPPWDGCLKTNATAS